MLQKLIHGISAFRYSVRT